MDELLNIIKSDGRKVKVLEIMNVCPHGITDERNSHVLFVTNGVKFK